MNVRRIKGTGVIAVSGECLIHLSTSLESMDIVCAVDPDDDETNYAVGHCETVTDKKSLNWHSPKKGRVAKIIAAMRINKKPRRVEQ